jgi:energy-coupling factor transporter transmembrane protein EcfT
MWQLRRKYHIFVFLHKSTALLCISAPLVTISLRFGESLITAFLTMVSRALIPLVLICILTLGSMPPGSWPWHASYASTETTNENALSIKSISTRYDSEFETFHVFGELTNNLQTPVQDIRLNVTFYNNQGNLTGSIISGPFFSHLRPGEKSAFDIAAQGDAAYRLMDFSYYKISRTWETAAESKETLMRMDIRDITLDPCGYYGIEGIVTNLAKEHTAGIEIAAAFYNEQNQVVGAGFTTIGERLDPTKNEQFKMVVEKEALPHFAYYSFNVQSDNYTSAVIEGEENLSNFHSLVPIGGKIMTVATEQPTYTIDEDKISVRGQVPPDEVKKREENSLALIKIVTGSGAVPVLLTAPVAKDGTFSREVEFQMDGSMIDRVFRVRAEYFGMTAESTFAVRDTPGGSGQLPSCKVLEKVSVSELNALMDGATGGNITDFLSGAQAKRGSEVVLSAVVDNELSRTQNVTVLYEVFDSKGLVVYLHVEEWTLEPNAQHDLRVAWLPEQEGTFVVKSFVVSTLSNPVLLSTGSPLSIKIVG